MMLGWTSDTPETAPLALRKKILDEDFVPYVKSMFARDASLRSAMLTVAQYWADEADDAVHATVVFSRRDTPIWPHPCRWDREEGAPALDGTEACSSCGDGLAWMPFDDNGGAIPAFQACCREDASQESTTAEAYLPYAVARRTASDGVEIEIVGAPVRAWLDEAEEGARPPASSSPAEDAETTALLDLVIASREDDGPYQVLADHLQQRGDPRGELITLSIAMRAAEGKRRDEIAARARELLSRHGRAWLGPLAAVVPPERAFFDRGLLRSVAVHFADDDVAARVIDAREWRTVEELRFLPQSCQRLSSSMRALRDVGPLDTVGLAELRRLEATLAVERVHVLLAYPAMIGEVAALELPSLRCLVLGSTTSGPGLGARRGINPFTREEIEIPVTSAASAELTPAVLAPLVASRTFARLEELVLVSVSPVTVSSWLSRASEARPKTLTFTSGSPTYEPSGFRVRVTGDVATVDMPALGESGVGELVGMLRALPPNVRIELVPTKLFAPTKADASHLAAAVGRAVRVA